MNFILEFYYAPCRVQSHIALNSREPTVCYFETSVEGLLSGHMSTSMAYAGTRGRAPTMHR